MLWNSLQAYTDGYSDASLEWLWCFKGNTQDHEGL
jgi:hypothetical protein